MLIMNFEENSNFFDFMSRNYDFAETNMYADLTVLSD